MYPRLHPRSYDSVRRRSPGVTANNRTRIHRAQSGPVRTTDQSGIPNSDGPSVVGPHSKRVAVHPSWCASVWSETLARVELSSRLLLLLSSLSSAGLGGCGALPPGCARRYLPAPGHQRSSMRRPCLSLRDRALDGLCSNVGVHGSGLTADRPHRLPRRITLPGRKRSQTQRRRCVPCAWSGTWRRQLGAPARRDRPRRLPHTRPRPDSQSRRTPD
jgi:hypothetical protein